MATTRDDIERALWRWSEWKADQRGVDEVLGLVDQYAAVPGAAPATDDALACARKEAEQIVQSARDEAAAIQSAAQKIPERLADSLSLAPRVTVPADIYRDADDVLWLRLGVDATNVLTMSRPTRKCSRCATVKPVSAFNHDRNSRDSRKAMCKGCESVGRKARGKGSNSKGVR